jgi:hypothetical protein
MNSKNPQLPGTIQKDGPSADGSPRPALTQVVFRREKSTRFEPPVKEPAINAHELFDLFTANIIKEKTSFIR